MRPSGISRHPPASSRISAISCSSPASTAWLTAWEGRPRAQNQAAAWRCRLPELRRIAPREPVAENLGEQLVVPVGAMLRVERHQEKVLLFEPLQHKRAIRSLAKQVDQVAVELLDNCRARHDALDLRRQRGENLLRKVARQLPRWPGESGDEFGTVTALAQGQCGHLQRDRPALGAFDKALRAPRPSALPSARCTAGAAPPPR